MDKVENKEVKINFEMLKSLPTHAIRDMGRSMGVKSPTSKTNSQIIEEIKLILEGKLEPYNSDKGRPSKQDRTTHIIEEFTRQFKEKNLVLNKDYLELEKLKQLNLQIVEKLYKLSDYINELIELICKNL